MRVNQHSQSAKAGEKMRKERLTIHGKEIVVVLSATFLLFEGTYGANSAVPYTKSNSENQSRQTSKPVYKQVKGVTSNPSTFTPSMSFSEAIDILRNSTRPPLNIVVLWKDLEGNADIYRDTPIGMDGVSKVPLRTHLKLLLMSVSGGGVEKLGYVIEDGVITIATQGSLPKKMVARIYDITDLAAAPANYRFMPGLGMLFGGMGYGRQGFNRGMMPSGGMGYGRQGLYGGMMPYRGGGRRTYLGRVSTGTGFNTNPYITRRYRR